MSFVDLIESRRVLLCVGAGGVGKTTTSAALALLAAKRGRRVLCLTIDPARRLAQSLGLEQLRADAQVVAEARFEAARLRVPGSLTVMMLNTKRTFDEIVERYASSPDSRDRILRNRLYEHVSSALSGTREYMAMEKLYAVKDDPAYDTVILDTPPTSHALDFLDAPQKLIEALDSPATHWFIQAFGDTGQLSFNLLARSAATAVRVMGRLTGKGFLDQVGSFLTDIHQLFGGFSERARRVGDALRSADVAYVLVTAPAPAAVREALMFAKRLQSFGTRVDAMVVNRVHVAEREAVSVSEARRALDTAGIALGAHGPERVVRAVQDESGQAHVDASHLRQLDELLQGWLSTVPRAYVPALPYDVHDLEALDLVARTMAGAPASTSAPDT